MQTLTAMATKSSDTSRLMRSDHAKEIDAILSVRGKLLEGRLPLEKEKLAHRIEDAMLNCKGNAVEVSVEYETLVKSISRLIAKYYTEEGNPVHSITPKLQELIPPLAEHLRTEVDMARELEIPKSFIGRCLAKFSIFEISDACYYLKNIAEGDEVVARNRLTIIHASLNRRKLEIMYNVADGAKKTKYTLAVLFDGDRVVIPNLDTVIYAAIDSGDLNKAYDLAKKAKKTEDDIAEKFRDCKAVMVHLPTIISESLDVGDLNAAYAFAEKIKEGYDPRKVLRIHQAIL
jgi:hypothetical protein